MQEFKILTKRQLIFWIQKLLIKHDLCDPSVHANTYVCSCERNKSNLIDL